MARTLSNMLHMSALYECNFTKLIINNSRSKVILVHVTLQKRIHEF
jgi:hypothetical protein